MKKLIVLKRIHDLVDEVLVLVEEITNLGPFNLSDEIGMSVACTTIVLYFRKGRYAGHMKWDSLRKSPIGRRIFHEAGNRGRHSNIFAGNERKLIATNCPTSTL